MSKQCFETGYIRKVTNQDLYEFVACDSVDEMFCAISKIYCFDDIDNTYEVVAIFCKGFKVEYVGWQPAMHYEYKIVGTNTTVWEGWFENWEH